MLSAFTLWLHYMTFLESQNHETKINSKGTFIKTWYISKKKKYVYIIIIIYIYFLDTIMLCNHATNAIW